MYWYLGCLDFGRFGFYTIFKVQHKNEELLFIRFDNINEFPRSEMLDEHRILRPVIEQKYEKLMSERYVTMDKAIQHIILDAINHIDTNSEKDKLELSLYIARRIHLSDPRF